MIKTFHRGGVHPQENKLSAEASIQQAALPTQAIFFLNQHIGAPAEAVVKKGDAVKVGTLIAKASSFVSAPVHSSVSGIVEKVGEALDSGGHYSPAIFIKVDGDEWESGIDATSEVKHPQACEPKSSQSIVDAIRDAGIVGMGGACFPTHVKLTIPKGCKAEILLINGVECEPYLTADHRMMLEHTEEIMIGVSLLMKAVNVDKAIIGIEANKPDAIRAMTDEAEKYDGISVQALKVRYPQGGEKQLIKALTGREVPAPPAIPVNVGAVVQNVATAFAVYEAVMKHKPLISRIVTVTGKLLSKPQNFMARLGTPLTELVDACGGMPEDTGKVLLGGPMMGRAVQTLDIPLAKGTSGVVLLTDKEAHRLRVRPCIRCAKCVGVCPMGLEPYLIATASAEGNWETDEANDITSCIECACCQYICPSNRPLLDRIRIGKQQVMQRIRERSKK